MAEILRSAIDLAHRNIVHPLLTRGEARDDREIAHERALDLSEAIQNNRLAMTLLPTFFTLANSSRLVA